MQTNQPQQSSSAPCPYHLACPYEKIAILGVGAVGATYAYTLMHHGLAKEIVLIDKNQQRAEGEVADLLHCTPYGNQVRFQVGTLDDCQGAGLIVITAGVAQQPGESRLQLVERNLKIFESFVPKITELAPQAILLIVTNPVDIMTQLTHKLSGMPPNQIIGSGTVLDSARLRREIAHYFQIDARNVHAYVVGEHGDSEVVAWSGVHVGTLHLDEYCQATGQLMTHDHKQEIDRLTRQAAYYIIQRKGATQFAVAVSLQLITEAILSDQNSVLTVSSSVQGMYGITDDICLSTPCIVNRNGVTKKLELQINTDELSALQHSAEVLSRSMPR